MATTIQEPASPAICPECAQGKCINCVGMALNDNDQLVECQCTHDA